MILYRLLRKDEIPSEATELWFTSDPLYIKRVRGQTNGKRKYIDRENSGLLIIDIPDELLSGKLRRHGKAHLGKYAKAPAYHTGMTNVIQVKYEHGAINFGFYGTDLIKEMLADSTRTIETNGG